MSKNRQSKSALNPPQSDAEISTVTQSISFSGPLPPPAILAQYNQVIPNGAERIMAMAERQSAHRESLEKQVVAGNLASQARGSIFAFTLCLLTILGGFSLIWMGKNVDGLVAIVGSLATLAGVFAVGRLQQSKERADKEKALALRRKA